MGYIKAYRGEGVKFLFLLTMLLSTALNANFNFGECYGSGTFEQQIHKYTNYEDAALVGTIPAGIKGLKVTLVSDTDVDIRLYGENEDKIVHWPYGLLNHYYQETKPYKDVPVTYSGYNGVEGEKGHEFIEVNGTTPTEMTMKAFGYRAGYATVNYSWTGKEGCTSSESGTGSFTQALEQNATSLVGTIPPNVDNVQINLTSAKDLDIQLYGADGTAIASWKPTGLMSGPTNQSIMYHDMNITWSGYNGTDGQAGHEYITVTPKTTEVLVMKVFGYEAGSADVTYSWGEVVSDTTLPVITLNGEVNVTIKKDETYTELNATAVDNVDGNISVTINGTVDTSTVGTYTITYTAVDNAGNQASLSREVNVIAEVVLPHNIPKLSNQDKEAYLTAINNARATARGCGEKGYFHETAPLVWSEELYKSAYEHSQDMANSNHYGHNGSGTEADWTGFKENKQSNHQERIESYDSRLATYSSENIAGGAKTIAQVVNLWLESDGHCANIMNPELDQLGMAMVEKENTDYIYYWTQNFSKVGFNIILNGESVVTLLKGEEYEELGAVAKEGDIDLAVNISGEVDHTTVGTYYITYSATDSQNYTASSIRAVKVVEELDITSPTITLNGEDNITLFQGDEYIELGASATDSVDGDIPVTIKQNVNSLRLGKYIVTYSATNSNEKYSFKDRVVTVVKNSYEADIPALEGNIKDDYLDAINSVRSQARSCGDTGDFPAVSALTWSEKLYKASYEHSQDMAKSNTFSFSGSGETSDWTGKKLDKQSIESERLRSYGYNPTKTIGSSVGAGRETFEEVLNLWLEDPVNCSRIMSAEAFQIGTARDYNVDADYHYYWTFILGYEDKDTAPTIHINGYPVVSIVKNQPYHELGATAFDNEDGELSISTTGVVDTSNVGIYTVTYKVVDSGRNKIQKQRVVHVVEEGDMVYPIVNISEENNSSLEKTIAYDAITLELTTQNTQELFAINRTLANGHNRNIRIRGVKSDENFYLYNIPLVKGANDINVTAVSNLGVESSKIFTVHTELNATVPIGIRATKHSAVDSLETNITVETLLDAKEYLFDTNGDGVIDEIKEDENLTITLDVEGRYRPRVTIRTNDGLLFSSNYYALGLDVKADIDQKDPEGAEPIDIAKEFVQALIEDDRGKVERFFLSSGSRWIRMLYEDEVRRTSMREYLRNINASDWKQEYQPSGAATVTTTVHDSKTNQDMLIGFELSLTNFDGTPRGRMWFIRAFY